MSTATASQNIKGSQETWGIWERLVPGQIHELDAAGKRMMDIHMRRYKTAQRFVSGKRVLDIASGTGYGSKMLKEAGALSVTGVDLSPLAVTYAKEHCQLPGVEWFVGNAEEYDNPEAFDVVASFETIEHLPHPEVFLARVRKLLKPNGTLLISVPIGETRHIDSYHLHVFSTDDVYALLAKFGFEVQASRYDDWKVGIGEMMQWQKIYPESKVPVSQLLGTWRGRRVLWDLITRRCIQLPMLMIAARHSAQTPCSMTKIPPQLD